MFHKIEWFYHLMQNGTKVYARVIEGPWLVGAYPTAGKVVGYGYKVDGLAYEVLIPEQEQEYRTAWDEFCFPAFLDKPGGLHHIKSMETIRRLEAQYCD